MVLLILGIAGIISILVLSVLYIVIKLKDKKSPIIEEEEFAEVNQ